MFTFAVHAAPPHNAAMNIRFFLGGRSPPGPSRGQGNGETGFPHSPADAGRRPAHPGPGPREGLGGQRPPREPLCIPSGRGLSVCAADAAASAGLVSVHISPGSAGILPAETRWGRNALARRRVGYPRCEQLPGLRTIPPPRGAPLPALRPGLPSRCCGAPWGRCAPAPRPPRSLPPH